VAFTSSRHPHQRRSAAATAAGGVASVRRRRILLCKKAIESAAWLEAEMPGRPAGQHAVVVAIIVSVLNHQQQPTQYREIAPQISVSAADLARVGRSHKSK